MATNAQGHISKCYIMQMRKPESHNERVVSAILPGYKVFYNALEEWHQGLPAVFRAIFLFTHLKCSKVTSQQLLPRNSWPVFIYTTYCYYWFFYRLLNVSYLNEIPKLYQSNWLKNKKQSDYFLQNHSHDIYIEKNAFLGLRLSHFNHNK